MSKFLKIITPEFPCVQQQGFQTGYSCITAVFNLHETVLYMSEQRSEVYSAFLDIQGAFDVVWHDGLFYKLGELGITGKLLRLLINSYSDINCVVRLQAKTSDTIKVTRGVRQGGVLSSFFYLVYIDELLYKTQESNSSAKLLSVKSGNPSFADDISLISISPADLQSLVDITCIYNFSKLWYFSVNASKSCILVYTVYHQ